MRKIDLFKLMNLIERNKAFRGVEVEVEIELDEEKGLSSLYLSCLNSVVDDYCWFATIYENGTLDALDEGTDILGELENSDEYDIATLSEDKIYEHIVDSIIANVLQSVENKETFLRKIRSIIGNNEE